MADRSWRLEKIEKSQMGLECPGVRGGGSGGLYSVMVVVVVVARVVAASSAPRYVFEGRFLGGERGTLEILSFVYCLFPFPFFSSDELPIISRVW